MMLTGTQLDNLLLYTGISVWVIILARCALRGNLLRITPNPNFSVIRIGWKIIVMVLVFFLVATGFVHEIFNSLRIQPAGSVELHDLTLQMLTDIVVKILAAFGMIMILRRTIDLNLLFDTKEIIVTGLLKRWPTWAQIPLLAIVIYLAIFPLINKLLLWLGIILADKVFNMPAPQGHQVFQLLNDPQTSIMIKTVLLLLAVLISPIAEELFFRGLIQNLAYKKFRQTGSAITFTAILFTVVHIPMYHQFPALFALGLVLGWSYYRFRSLLVPIAVHILFNATTLILWSLGFVE